MRVVSCYSPTNVSDETDITKFYNELFSPCRQIPKHNVLVVRGDMNVQIGKNENNKYCLHNIPNRNGELLAGFSLENRLKYKIPKKKRQTMDLHIPKQYKIPIRLYPNK